MRSFPVFCVIYRAILEKSAVNSIVIHSAVISSFAPVISKALACLKKELHPARRNYIPAIKPLRIPGSGNNKALEASTTWQTHLHLSPSTSLITNSFTPQHLLQPQSWIVSKPSEVGLIWDVAILQTPHHANHYQNLLPTGHPRPG